MANTLKEGDLVEVIAIGRIEEESESGYMVNVHGESVPVLASQVRLLQVQPAFSGNTWQARQAQDERIEALGQLAKDWESYFAEIAPFTYKDGRRAAPLRERARELGIEQ